MCVCECNTDIYFDLSFQEKKIPDVIAKPIRQIPRPPVTTYWYLVFDTFSWCVIEGESVCDVMCVCVLCHVSLSCVCECVLFA